MHQKETANGTHSHCHAHASMPQVDFAPSIAVMMGVPIPFGNIGQISRLLWDVAHSSTTSGITLSSSKVEKHGASWKSAYATALSRNAAQVGSCLVGVQPSQLIIYWLSVHAYTCVNQTSLLVAMCSDCCSMHAAGAHIPQCIRSRQESHVATAGPEEGQSIVPGSP